MTNESPIQEHQPDDRIAGGLDSVLIRLVAPACKKLGVGTYTPFVLIWATILQLGYIGVLLALSCSRPNVSPWLAAAIVVILGILTLFFECGLPASYFLQEILGLVPVEATGGYRRSRGEGLLVSVIGYIYTLATFAMTYWFLSQWNKASFSEPLDVFNAFYFSVITMATVGYGDIHPLTVLAKTVVMFEIFTGLMFTLIIFGSAMALTTQPRSLPSLKNRQQTNSQTEGASSDAQGTEH